MLASAMYVRRIANSPHKFFRCLQSFEESCTKIASVEETRSSWSPQSSQVSSADFSHDAPPPRESDERSHFSQASSSCGTTSSLIQDVARVMESRLHLKPGRGCIVGEGLTTVDLGIFVDGKQIAIQLDQSPATISTPEGTGPSTARLFAERKTQQRVLQSFGWVVASLMDKEWHDAGSDDHVKVHLIVEAVNKALGKEDDSQGEHHYHHAGCGCSH